MTFEKFWHGYSLSFWRHAFSGEIIHLVMLCNFKGQISGNLVNTSPLVGPVKDLYISLAHEYVG